MSPPEILYRMFNFLQKKIEKIRDVGKSGKAVLISTPPRILPAAENDKLYDHKIKIFDTFLDYTEDIKWHTDLHTLKRIPKIFSKDINILNKKYGSAKHVWEVNRLLFLPQICLNYSIKKDKKYLRQFISINDSWISDNPYLLGINWYSNIEVNIRLINWFLSWEILEANKLIESEPEFKDFVYNRWLPVIYMHCLYSYRNPSRFSSANNHLISEYAGLFIATSLWKFKDSAKWNIYAKKGLEAEIQKQHSENGINKEEAAEYIQFITDFFLLAYIVGEKTNNRFSPGYKLMLKKIFQYIYGFTDIKGNFPNYGDEDDGRVIILEHEKNYSNFKSLLTSGSIIYNDRELKTRSGGFDMKNRILFGKKGKIKFDSIKSTTVNPGSCIYKSEGHLILRKQSGNKEIYIHMNAAPLGYLSIAAHGHSDALSFILRLDGKGILVDTGTFSYHTHPEWRQYFIGTLAHNTIRINKKNQALNGGPTLWLKHYKTEVKEIISNENHDKIIAAHNGYRASGIQHIRELIFSKTDNTIQITDFLESDSGREYFIEFPLHLHPDMFPEKHKNYISVVDSSKNEKIKIFYDAKFDINIVKGQKSSIMGWYSGSFYRKEPSHMIYQTFKASSSISFKTKINIC
ncbi:MAG: alginate lyase family protein [Bacteroidales bacterium]|nr:MAG: alginate lyase family protein [Bacteroidales bacterium]